MALHHNIPENHVCKGLVIFPELIAMLVTADLDLITNPKVSHHYTGNISNTKNYLFELKYYLLPQTLQNVNSEITILFDSNSILSS